MASTVASREMTGVAKGERRPWPVKLIVTHNRPHFDEVLAIFMLKKWSGKFFPGVEEANVEAWSEGGVPAEYKKAGKACDDLLREQQVLAVGTCGGILDEHGKETPTCAHLVTEYLGIADKPELQQILQFCKRVDHDGHSMPFDLHSLMKVMYDFYGDQDDGLQQVLNWAMEAIEAYIYGQHQFFACEKEFEKAGKIIAGPVKIATVQSNNPKMDAWLRWKHGIDIIVQRRDTRHTIILSRPGIKLEMVDVARIVRMREMQKRRILLPSWQALEVSGGSTDCPWWYFYKEAGQLLNGSLTASEMEPTQLSSEEVVRAVVVACAPLVERCEEPKCGGSQCEKYQLGLMACRRKRYEQKTARK